MKRNEPVSKIMSSDVNGVHLGQKVSEVRTLLIEKGFHHVPVLDGKEPIGILSSTDIMRASFGTSDDEINSTLDHTTSIEDLMSKELKTIDVGAPIREAAEILSEASYHSLLVLEGKELVGIVTSTDLIRYLLAQF